MPARIEAVPNHVYMFLIRKGAVPRAALSPEEMIKLIHVKQTHLDAKLIVSFISSGLRRQNVMPIYEIL